MFCEKCGNKIPNDSKFCVVCGAKINVALPNATQTDSFTEQFNLNKPTAEAVPKQRIKWWQILIIVALCLLIIGIAVAIVWLQRPDGNKAKTGGRKLTSSSQTKSSYDSFDDDSDEDSDYDFEDNSDSIKLEYSDLSNIGRSSIDELLRELIRGNQVKKSGVELCDNLTIIKMAEKIGNFSLLDRRLMDKYFVEEYDLTPYYSKYSKTQKFIEEIYGTENRYNWYIADSVSESVLETVKEKLMEDFEYYNKGTDEENEKVHEMITEEVEGLEGIYLYAYELEPELKTKLEAEFEAEFTEDAIQYLVVEVNGKYFLSYDPSLAALITFSDMAETAP